MAFLSHRYRSPDVNQFFYRLFADVAHVEFSVDRGTLATNVTRLERLMRDADGFVGLYPFPGTSLEQPDRAALASESRYFRLELDLAERSGKPAIAFIDNRYGNVLDPAPGMLQCRFDWQEIAAERRSPRDSVFSQAFKAFAAQVRAWQALELAQGVSHVRGATVGIALPPADGAGRGYARDMVDTIAALVEQTGAQPEVFAWPPRLDMPLAHRLRGLDWAIVDLGPASAATGLPAYLHGRFIPAMRLLQTAPADPDATPALLSTLFGALEVGYVKDIVRWHDAASLTEGVSSRLATIGAQRERIATQAQAQTYFNSAALRKERVFVSYTGRDADLASGLIAALKRRFQDVFDYRDGNATIPAGTPWIDMVFQRLAAAPIGIPLLSAGYLASGNCVHEAQLMVAQRDARHMRVIPVKLRNEPLDLPPWLRMTQYLRHWECANADAAAAAIVAAFESAPPS